MKLPDNLHNITISKSNGISFFPGTGYKAIESLNNNTFENYGMYWQFGKEEFEPIICYTDFENFIFIPEFQCLDSFVKFYQESNGRISPPVNLKDSTFFLNLFYRGKVLTKSGSTEMAISVLEQSINLFSEFSESWALLSQNYEIIGNIEKANIAALNAIISNYLFGKPSKKAVEQFIKIDLEGNLKNNPIVKRIGLFLDSGNKFDYKLLLAIIDEFKEIGDLKSAFLLKQNYGYLMSLESAEFKRNQNFEENEWYEELGNEIKLTFPQRS